jgi:hypothetical protein
MVSFVLSREDRKRLSFCQREPADLKTFVYVSTGFYVPVIKVAEKCMKICLFCK